jgi:Zn-dependent oligopeptidase
MPKSFKGVPTSKIKRKKMRTIKKQHKKWTITHQMCTHYYLIGGTSSPTNREIVIDSQTKDASKNEKEKLVNESLKGLAIPKPLVFELSFLVMTNHASI